MQDCHFSNQLFEPLTCEGLLIKETALTDRETAAHLSSLATLEVNN